MKTVYLAATALLAVALVGCSGTDPRSDLESASPSASTGASTPTATASAAYDPPLAPTSDTGMNEDGDYVNQEHSWGMIDDPKVAFPITIDHVYGKTTIGKQPKRLVTLDMASTGSAVALVRVPNAFPKTTEGGNAKGVYTWMEGVLEGFQVPSEGPNAPVLLDMSNGLPLDAIKAAKPDIILALQDDLSEADYKGLSEIAPVVVRPGRPGETSPEDLILTTGKALGQYNHAKEFVAQSKEVYPEDGRDYGVYKGKTVIVARLTADAKTTLHLYPAQNIRTQVVTQLGFNPAEVVQNRQPSGTSQTIELSEDQAAQATSDVVIAVARNSEEAARLRTHPVLQALPAAKNGNLVIIDTPAIAQGLASGDPISSTEALRSLDRAIEAQAKLH